MKKTNEKLTVGIIFGGRSGEHEVSLVSASSIIAALDKEKYEVVPIGISPSGRWLSSAKTLSLLKTKNDLGQEPERFLVPEPNRRSLVSVVGESDLRLDVVIPVVHGTYGEDGTLQGLLELANIPYVGSGVLGSALGMDKIVQKQLYERLGIPTARYLWFFSSEWKARPKRVVSQIEKHLRYPVFTKPANTGSSVGISKAHHRKELMEFLSVAAGFDRKVIVEQGVKNAREIECAVLGNEEPVASVPGEIIPSNEFYDYEAKYVDGKSQAVIPARLPSRVAKEIRSLAVQAFAALDLAGMARVDFFVTPRNALYLNEVNTIPGFTSISMYPKLWEATGIGYAELLDRLISLALERHRQKSGLRTHYQPASDWYKT